MVADRVDVVKVYVSDTAAVGVVTVIEKSQLEPAARLAPCTESIALELLFAVCVKLEPAPQLLAAGKLLMVALGMIAAMSCVKVMLVALLALSVLVMTKV